MSNDLVESVCSITTIDIDNKGSSVFADTEYDLANRAGMFLSQQINAVNFRLRQSLQGYTADWHVAGDPTLIIVLAGVLRIILRNGDQRNFAAGDMFIAKDRLMPGQRFDKTQHGHRAEVIGAKAFHAVHIKLGRLGEV